ncbi:uncharacterized protein Z518_06568 [Rhinocladiella mackenziei CBS 650.93]|uniref:Altered inheritance of mitochondria protein 21 n=1 Tax=Rhinocladiella mackenziei CBS 650.93 TaxID=1442369 RepID=A0A0D2GXY0_9EURO|nr:uncharacterized protein Z518_06568 [Rhinocladiella mackenziei CBS 650.93]KIX03018.1 hypothetical protein Z518_06568 [Rhinocladiella mackenziei CBS 650.93]
MSAQIVPTVPPRPVRVQQALAHGANKLPDVPRPINKRLDRSVSPGNYPRSPLNEPWPSNLARQKTTEQQSAEALPRRPSVQNLPSVGQEGMEYAEILDMQTNQQPPVSALAADAAAQTRNIGQDLTLHAPKPSLPKSSATAQVQAVTRTDSQQAAAHGIGEPSTPSQDEGDALPHVRARTSFSRPSSAVAGERRSSIYGDESGPAELGLRVPINPLLGDVQAPSPAPGLSPSHTGSNGEQKRRPNHSRTKSGRENFAPPGSYGLHGHGIPPQDKFEKDWYAKHPEAAQHEETHGHGVYESIGSGRGAFALSSDDLNKIVRDTASRGAGLGTSRATDSYPDEQIGYQASDLYVSRSQINTPNSLAKTITNTSQPAAESPLRKTSFLADEPIPAEVRRGRLSVSGRSDDHPLESEAEQEVHIQPQRRYNKVTGGEETLNETEDVRASGENDYINEHGYSVPILAADEVAKEEGIEHLQPAVSPNAERRGSSYDLEHRSGDATPSSRPSSRPSSVYGLHNSSHSLTRFTSHHDDRENMHTPLEDVEEYEPLFPEDDDEKRPVSNAERFKQIPHALKQRFPSQDIWEDTPSSALYSATVSTPDLPNQTEKPASKTFEPPKTEAARKDESAEDEQKKLLPSEERLAQFRFAPLLRDDMPTRPGMVPRFPSSDIWEDSPESHQLVTTVSTPPVENEGEGPAEVPIKPFIPSRPAGKSRSGEGASSAQVAPSIPARPPKTIQSAPPTSSASTDTAAPKGASTSPEPKNVPSIPDRPKPQIPARPAKKALGEGLTKTVSGESTGPTGQEKASPPIAKVKPQIPARPGQSSKIANLRGNFMNDLNQKLGLGPPKEKEPEPVAEETKPLEDARKGRARGPQRRAPAKSPAAVVKPQFAFSMFTPRSLWTIDDADELNVTSDEAPAPKTTSTEQAPSSAPPDASLLTAIDTTDHDKSKGEAEVEKGTESEPEAAATRIPSNTSSEFVDPTLGTPSQEKSNPLSPKTSNEKVMGLSKHSTASPDQTSGPELERESPDPNIAAIPASKQTTASTEADTAPLEKSPTQESRSVTLTEGEPDKVSTEDA